MTEQEIRIRVAARLRELRGEKSQEEIGRLSGVHQAQISQYELGKVLPGLENLVHLCRAYGVPVTEITRLMEVGNE